MSQIKLIDTCGGYVSDHPSAASYEWDEGLLEKWHEKKFRKFFTKFKQHEELGSFRSILKQSGVEDSKFLVCIYNQSLEYDDEANRLAHTFDFRDYKHPKTENPKTENPKPFDSEHALKLISYVTSEERRNKYASQYHYIMTLRRFKVE